MHFFNLDIERVTKQEEEKQAKQARLKAMWMRTKDNLIEYNQFMDRLRAGQRPTLAQLRSLNRFQFKGYE